MNTVSIYTAISTQKLINKMYAGRQYFEQLCRQSEAIGESTEMLQKAFNTAISAGDVAEARRVHEHAKGYLAELNALHHRRERQHAVNTAMLEELQRREG